MFSGATISWPWFNRIFLVSCYWRNNCWNSSCWFMHWLTISARTARLQTGRVCLKSPPKRIILFPKWQSTVWLKSLSNRLSSLRNDPGILDASSQTITRALASSLAFVDPRLNLLVESLSNGTGRPNLEWHICPQWNSDAAIPDHAVEWIISFRALTRWAIAIYRNVLPAPPGPWMYAQKAAGGY